MKNLKHIALLAAFLLGLNFVSTSDVFAQPGTAQNQKSSESMKSGGNKIADEILRLERERNQAMVRQDRDALDRMTTDDYMSTARVPARIMTKAEIREADKAQRAANPFTVESMTHDDEKVRVHGDSTAISTGSWKRVSKDSTGKDTSASGRFTHVWVKQNGKWLLAAAHYSPFAELAPRK